MLLKHAYQTFPKRLFTFISFRYRHKDLQYYRSNSLKPDEGIASDENVFDLGRNADVINKIKKPQTIIEDYVEGEDNIDHWSTEILGKLIPNEETLDALYVIPKMMRKGGEWVEVKQTPDEIKKISFSEIPIAFIKASFNNTIITISEPLVSSAQFITYGKGGKPEDQVTMKSVLINSCGLEGYKNAKKGTNVAAQAVGQGIATKCMQRGITMVRVVVSGLGPGRMASVKGLMMGGLKIISITDNTPVPLNGHRPRKQRRI